eukprot:gene12217-13474_t
MLLLNKMKIWAILKSGGINEEEVAEVLLPMLKKSQVGLLTP